MKIAKWGNSLAVRIPKDVAEALGLVPGDEVELSRGDGSVLRVDRVMSRQDIVERIADMAKPLPPGWKFDRDEIKRR